MNEMATAGELVVFEGIKYGRGEYKAENDEIRRDFVDYTVENNIKRAENYLIESRKQRNAQKRKGRKKKLMQNAASWRDPDSGRLH